MINSVQQGRRGKEKYRRYRERAEGEREKKASK